MKEPSCFRFITLAMLVSLSAGRGGANSDRGSGGSSEQHGVNPFVPTDLELAVDALSAALGDQPGAGDVKVSIVANRHSNYWTPAQIGTGRAASAIGCFSTFDAT